MKRQHPKQITMMNFVLLYFFSLQKYAKECFEVEVLQKLFEEKLEKQLYKQWLKIRENICKMLKRDLRDAEKLVLSECYLQKHEAIVVAERSGFGSQQEL